MLDPFQYLPKILSESLTKCKLSSLTKEQAAFAAVVSAAVDSCEAPSAPRPGTFPGGICLRVLWF